MIHTNLPARLGKHLGILATLALAPLLFLMPQAHAADYTVCGSGCDFATLTAALQSPGLGTTPDTLTVTSDYVFDDNVEDDNVSLPSNIAITCEAGADSIGKDGFTEMFFGGSSNMTWQDCTFENVSWDYTNADNVHFIHNTWSANHVGSLTFTNATNITLQDNIDIQHIQIQTVHDMTITGNTFAMRYDNTGLYVGVAGGPDFSNPVEVSGDVLVQNNVFNNYLPNNGGDWININGGNNIQFLNNTVQSQVTVNDIYLTMIELNNGQAEFKNNYIIQPLKSAPRNNATVAFNMRTDVYDTDGLYEHNTIIMRNGGSSGANQNSCWTLFDGGGHANVPMHITANYNLCDQDGTNFQGVGFELSYVLGSSDVTLTDSFNGFSNIATPVADGNNNIITTVNANSERHNALLRRENVDTSDDYHPSPVSRYLDIDGAQDIGAYSDVRRTPINIDDDCVVDYVTCDGQTTFTIQEALKNGETATMAAGTYPRFGLQDFDDITITGAGADTIVDGGGVGALELTRVTNSHINDIAVAHANASTSSYDLTMSTYSSNLIDYNTFGPITLFFNTNACGSVPIVDNTPTDVTGEPGIGTEDLNLFIIEVPGSPYITAIAPPSIANSAHDLAVMCGAPDSVVTFFPSFLTVNNGNYTLNDGAITTAGYFPTGGSPAPSITHNVSASIGLQMLDAVGNVLSGLTFPDNAVNLSLNGTTDNNIFSESDLTGAGIYDIRVYNTGNTTMDQTDFGQSTVDYQNTGTITVRYKARAFVKDPNNNFPIEGASVTFTDQANNVTGPLLTDSSGLTTYTPNLPGVVLRGSNPTGANTGGNPYTVVATKTGFTTGTVTANLTAKNQQVLVTTPAIYTPVSGPTGGGGSGGGFSAPVTGTPTGPDTNNPTNNTHPSPTEELPSPTTPKEIITEQQKLLASFPGYTDLSKTDAAYTAFAYAFRLGAIQGFEDGTVAPLSYLQRDQIAKMVATSIYKISPDVDYCKGAAPFPDVPLDNWAAQYICFGKAHGILTGYFDHGEDAGKYKPERVVSRVELVAILTRALPKMKILGNQGNYADIFPGPWYVDYAAIAYRLQLFPTNLALGAEQPARRIEIARILYSLHLQGLIP